MGLDEPVVIAETDGFETGDGTRAVMGRHDLVIEFRLDDYEGTLTIPILALLDAIEQQNRRYGS